MFRHVLGVIDATEEQVQALVESLDEDSDGEVGVRYFMGILVCGHPAFA